MSIQETDRELHPEGKAPSVDEMTKAYAIDQAMRLIRRMDLRKVRLVIAFSHGLLGE